MPEDMLPESPPDVRTVAERYLDEYEEELSPREREYLASVAYEMHVPVFRGPKVAGAIFIISLAGGAALRIVRPRKLPSMGSDRRTS